MDFRSKADAYLDALAKDISALCRINSVEGEAKPGMPFGEGPAKALEEALRMGRELGFKTENFDNYVGHIEFGEGEEMVGILGHVDVVPAGEGWERDPWGGEIADGRIWGRGTLDDKGPVLTCLYAMKILKDMNIPLKRRVRIILGTNEETNWGCMDYYLNKVKPELPTLAFSPDSEFPVTYAELGMLQYTLTRPLTEDLEIEGGNAFNAVPSIAKVALPAELGETLKKEISESEDPSIYSVEEKDGKQILVTRGVGAHAAHLQEGKNAVSYMMELLGRLPLTGELAEVVNFYNEHFGTCLYGEKMGIAVSDEVSGPLTLNVGMISSKDGKLVLSCDSRIPVSIQVSDIEAKVNERIAKAGYTMEVASIEQPLYVAKDSELVQTLMNAYKTVTRDTQSQPMASGGATYSRTMKNCVAFGCLLPDQVDTMHQANESLELDKLKIWLEVMTEAIYQLAK